MNSIQCIGLGAAVDELRSFKRVSGRMVHLRSRDDMESFPDVVFPLDITTTVEYLKVGVSFTVYVSFF